MIVSGIAFEGGAAPTPPAAAGGLTKPPRRKLRATIAILLVLLGLCGIIGGGVALYLEFTRSATPAEVSAAGSAELASRWTRLTAGQLFPASVGYATSDGLQSTASRVGIAPAASCAAALDPSVAAILRRLGCRTVLRATYLDPSGTLVATVAVAVMSSPRAAQQAGATVTSDLPKAGVRALTFPGTTAGQFTDAQRGWFQATPQGTYLLFYAAGYADGRPGATADIIGPPDLGQGVMERVVSALSGGKPPCQRKDIQC